MNLHRYAAGLVALAIFARLEADSPENSYKGSNKTEALLVPRDGKKGLWRLVGLSPFTLKEMLSAGDIDRDGGMDHHDGLAVRDLDGDGDLDLVSIGWAKPQLWVYENLRTSPRRP